MSAPRWLAVALAGWPQAALILLVLTVIGAAALALAGRGPLK